MRTIHRIDIPSLLPIRKRTAAYARVSSGKDAMLHSLSAQISFFSELIQRNPEWEFAGIYADEAFTGTRDERPELQRLMQDCRDGKVDMILTKSISRFARNTVTTLELVRELKLLGIGVWFDRENIYSLSGDGELMLTILSSFAQEESRSASENQKWRIRKNFKEGKVSGIKMLGYRLEKGVLQIVPEEAELVRAVFADYLSGMGIFSIIKKYESQGVKFTRSGLSKLLRNEKYQGDMLLQKTVTTDHLSKRRVINIGQAPQYYVTGSHEAIIDKDTFAAVQAEIERRAAIHAPKVPPPSKPYPFAGLVQCGKCGALYRRKLGNAGSKYSKPVLICPTFDQRGKAECDSQQIPEDILLEKAEEFGGLAGISEIRVPEHNLLTFVYNDGSVIDVPWQHRSRRESWTPEMREAVRQKMLARNKGRHPNE